MAACMSDYQTERNKNSHFLGITCEWGSLHLHPLLWRKTQMWVFLCLVHRLKYLVTMKNLNGYSVKNPCIVWGKKQIVNCYSILCKIYLKQLNPIWILTPHIFPCLFCHDVIARLPFSMCCGQMRQILALFEWNSRARDHVARKHAHDKLTTKPVCTDWNVAPYLRVFHARIHKQIPLIPIPNHPRSAHLLFVS